MSVDSGPAVGRGIQTTRLLLGAVGLGGAVYGAWLLWGERSDWLSLLIWLAAGVALHDFVLSPLLVLGGVLAPRLLPPGWRVPVVVAVVVWGSLTLLAVPVLGQFGALPDNPTLLDRPYGLSWIIGTAVVAALAVAAAVAGSRRRSTATDAEPSGHDPARGAAPDDGPRGQNSPPGQGTPA